MEALKALSEILDLSGGGPVSGSPALYCVGRAVINLKRVTAIYKFDGFVVPKARPRVTRRGTFLPPQYEQSQNQLTDSALTQHGNRPKWVAPLCLYEVPIGDEVRHLNHYAIHIFNGLSQTRGDGDNREGAYLDALVRCGLLTGDSEGENPIASRQWIPGLESSWVVVEDLGMPLLRGAKAKTKAGIEENIKRLLAEGRSQRQAVAIAYGLAGKKPKD